MIDTEIDFMCGNTANTHEQTQKQNTRPVAHRQKAEQ